MGKPTYEVAVTKIISVTLDPDKLDAEFWSEFNSSISDRGGPDNDYLVEHIAWNFVQGDEDFVEGVGDLKEMNVAVREIDTNIELERVL